MALSKTARKWLRGVVATTINGFASGVVLIVADPATFNLDNPRKLLLTSAVFALFGLANYLKEHPIPDEETTTVETKTTITHTPAAPEKKD